MKISLELFPAIMIAIGTILATALSGCGGESSLDSKSSSLDGEKCVIIGGFRVYTIDGCEYIMHGHPLVHKANCKNEFHRQYTR